MFGLSLTKLLILALVVALLLYAPRLLRRLGAPAGDGGVGGDGALESERCRVCGDFVVPAERVGCERSGCPYA